MSDCGTREAAPRPTVASSARSSAPAPANRAATDLERIRSWFSREQVPAIVYVLYSAVSEADLDANLGLPEYSYFFVREMFRAALEKSSRVIVVTDPPGQVDQIFDACQAQGLACVFLSFAPPHRTFLGLRCPTVPVFAWEFDTIPDEVWGEDQRNDWRYVLAQLGGAITHSQYSVRAIKNAMGSDFSVVSIPAPVWDAAQRASTGFHRSRHETLSVEGAVFDNRIDGPLPPPEPIPVPEQRRPGFVARLLLTGSFALQWYRAVMADLLPAPAKRVLTLLAAATYRRVLTKRRGTARSKPGGTGRASFTIPDDEIVYTCVFNPNDGRKNWQDVVTAFCTAFDACDDATLVLKFVHNDCTAAMAELKALLGKLRPHRCRVVAIAGFLDDSQYRALIGRTTFVVNASLSEGQCLPLMEFMSSGKPAIAPVNTAMEEYIEVDNAFIVESHPELCCWPHDSRFTFRARRYRVNWDSLLSAFERSYAVAQKEPGLCAEMGRRANLRLRGFCCDKIVLERLSQFLGASATGSIPSPHQERRGLVIGVDEVLERLASKRYFHGVPLPKLESDYHVFDPSRGSDVRQLVERFGIVTRGDSPPDNAIYVHRSCGRLEYASTFAFQGGGNVVVLGESNGFHGSLTLEGGGNTVVLMGLQKKLAVDATLYRGDTLICGRGAFAWGFRVWVQGGTTCTIGDDCLLSENISIRTSDHHSIIDLNTKRHANWPADVEIGKHVWIGPNCVVCKGVNIGDGSVVATNSVVTESIGPMELWGGVPARQIRRQVSWVGSLPPDPTETAALFDVLKLDDVGRKKGTNGASRDDTAAESHDMMRAWRVVTQFLDDHALADDIALGPPFTLSYPQPQHYAETYIDPARRYDWVALDLRHLEEIERRFLSGLQGWAMPVFTSGQFVLFARNPIGQRLGLAPPSFDSFSDIFERSHAPRMGPWIARCDKPLARSPSGEPASLEIVVAHYAEDLSWVARLPCPVTIISKTRHDLQGFVSPNAGREVPMFLAYIVKRYTTLPEVTGFFHGHDHSIHQDYPSEQIISSISLDGADYLNVNSGLLNVTRSFDTTPDSIYCRSLIGTLWPTLFEPYLGPLPDELVSYGNAQFFARKSLIRSVPVEAYRRWLSWIMTTDVPDYWSSRVFEYLWHYIFTRRAREPARSVKDYLRK